MRAKISKSLSENGRIYEILARAFHDQRILHVSFFSQRIEIV